MNSNFKKKQNLKQMKKIKLPYKIADGHIIAAKKFIKDKSTEKLTVDKLRQHLNNDLELSKLSRTGVYILLKKVMGYSYK